MKSHARWLHWGGILLLVILAGSGGCFQPPEGVPSLTGQLVPKTGHPPFPTEVRATEMGAGTYTFELPNETIEQESNVLSATVDADLWQVRVTWTNSEGDQRSATATANVINDPPIIRRPRLSPNGDWFLTPLVRALLDFNYHGGSGGATGVSDPDGDQWRIDSVEVMCSEKYGLADSIFSPPREAGLFRATYRGEIIENACVVYPTHTGELHPVVPSPAPLTERVEFVEPFAFADPGSTEYFILRNTGVLGVDLEGWTVTSDQGEVFRFPQGFRMQASAVVRVYTRSGANSIDKLYWDHEGGEVWNNTQGVATLRNAAGVIVHEYIYPGIPYARTQEDGYPYDPNNPHDLTYDHLTEWFRDPQHFIDWADRHIPNWREAYAHIGTEEDASVEEIIDYLFSDQSGNVLPTIRTGTATITVVARDEWGAVSSARFEIPVGARIF